jgi:hypothetical protein
MLAHIWHARQSKSSLSCHVSWLCALSLGIELYQECHFSVYLSLPWSLSCAVWSIVTIALPWLCRLV